MTVTRANGKPLLEHHSLGRYSVPRTANPRRALATYDRWLAVRAHTDDVDRQGLFGCFLDLVEQLGWRVSALCAIHADDLDLVGEGDHPYGRILKRAETDKMGVQRWVPLPQETRAVLLRILDQNPVVGTAPLFPAPRVPGKSWTRHHAKDMLERAERAAGLAPLAGSDFHAYRRAWATARKHENPKDVAAAGGWLSTDTLQKCYIQEDEATMLRVMSEPRRIRSTGAKP
jgi:integrase